MNSYTHLPSPLGPILLTSDGAGLTGLYMSEYKHGEEVRDDWILGDNAPLLQEAKRQLTAYFDGTLKEFDLPLTMRGTPFQLRVWEELTRIPYGTTISYGELARRVGNPNASRAVGLANGRNPISIIVPCHRVIGSDGKLTGYGGGLPRKSALLSFEAAVLAGGPRRLEMADSQPLQSQYELEFV
ncbi:MAG TPA: methylated-DNA--[protein]-cysteine S-methyltransferase [Chloroflexia bacterium]|nr:methylated-DNA--[protein]-cysteine S-methyltransferase [Chloroflexia bacterium]